MLTLKERLNATIRGKRFSILSLIATFFVMTLTFGPMQALAKDPLQTAQKNKRPNFLLIVADDMGYSDLGSYGGEINTPVLDKLAQQGMRYTDFYVSPTCSPTRSMLLTGTDNHIAGLGNMESLIVPNQAKSSGYEGVLNEQVVTVASLLRDGGYHTYMAGKWHLGFEPEEIPRARGFERDFSLLAGGASHFADQWNLEWQRPKAPYTEDGRPLDKLPEDFYSTKTYTDKTIQFIEEGRGDGKPFFAYLAFTAPHGPLHVPDDWLRRYKDRYDEGWDVIRQQRLARMQKLGIVEKGVNTADRLWFLPRSTQLAPAIRVLLGRKMELYASMIEYMDDQIGRLLDYLKQIGEYDNTVIIFFSDNGAEGNDLAALLSGRPGTPGFVHAANNFAEKGHNYIGRPNSYVEIGPAWAQASSTPFRLYKGLTAEGGIRSPLIISGPGVKGAGGINKKAILHVMDIAPTLLEMANVKHHPTYKGRKVAPMQGKSWTNMLSGKVKSPRSETDWLGWELFGDRAIRQGDWKISWLHRPFGIADWQLFNLANDLGEQNDLSKKFPEKKKALIKLWDEYVKTNGVIIGARSPFEQASKHLPNPVQEFDNYPPVMGLERLPWKKILELISR